MISKEGSTGGVASKGKIPLAEEIGRRVGGASSETSEMSASGEGKGTSELKKSQAEC